MMQLFHDEPLAFVIVALSPFIVGFVLWHVLTRDLRSSQFRQRSYEGLDVSDHQRPGDVHVVFHTYSGLLIYTLQEPHDLWLASNHAEVLLWRLHRSNLTRGLFAYGALVIPVLSYFNYLAQKANVRRQEKAFISQKKPALPEL